MLTLTQELQNESQRTDFPDVGKFHPLDQSKQQGYFTARVSRDGIDAHAYYQWCRANSRPYILVDLRHAPAVEMDIRHLDWQQVTGVPALDWTSDRVRVFFLDLDIAIESMAPGHWQQSAIGGNSTMRVVCAAGQAEPLACSFRDISNAHFTDGEPLDRVQLPPRIAALHAKRYVVSRRARDDSTWMKFYWRDHCQVNTFPCVELLEHPTDSSLCKLCITMPRGQVFTSVLISDISKLAKRRGVKPKGFRYKEPREVTFIAKDGAAMIETRLWLHTDAATAFAETLVQFFSLRGQQAQECELED